MDTTKRIWQRSVGIAIEPRQNKTTGDYFWSYKFTRAYKVGEEFCYADSFTEHNPRIPLRHFSCSERNTQGIFDRDRREAK